MSARLETAITKLHNLDASLTPVALGNAREVAIVEGLIALAENFGKEIEHTYIHSNGDIKFNIKGADQGNGEYGAGLAALLSKVPTRCGIHAIQADVLPQANWTWINHFDAEKLLKIVGEELFDIGVENEAPAPKM